MVDLGRITKAERLADLLAEKITNGTYPPGHKLPSESELITEYGVSRITVRNAFIKLRHMGLIVSEQGRGSFVRDPHTTPATTLDRTVYRAGKKFTDDPAWHEAGEPPAVTRTNLTGRTAELLQREDSPAAFVIDRLLTEDRTAARAAHRLVIPFDVADHVPELEATPDAPLTEVFGHLAAVFSLEWIETVTARTPLPDDHATLHMTEGTPLLITYRTTHDKQNGRPLLLEETRASAAGTTLTYRMNAKQARR